MIKIYKNSQMTEFINEYIHSERDRKILIDRFINGLTYKEQSLRYNMSERQLIRITDDAEELFDEIDRLSA